MLPKNTNRIKTVKTAIAKVSTGESRGESGIAAVPTTPGLAVPGGLLKIMAFILSLWPLYGFMLGVLYLAQPEPAAKKFGRVCLVLAVVGMVLRAGLKLVQPVLSGTETAELVGGYF